MNAIGIGTDLMNSVERDTQRTTFKLDFPEGQIKGHHIQCRCNRCAQSREVLAIKKWCKAYCKDRKGTIR